MTDQSAKYDDLINLICGEELGDGISRNVFVFYLNPKWVVKIAVDCDSYFQNITEWMIWNELSEWKKMKKWFAPCKFISNSGRILIQQRTEPVRLSDIPEKIPYFFTDQKLDNYGMINGQFVCHDYGTIPMTKSWNNRMKKHNFTPNF